MPEKNGDHPISILLIIIHGLIRARDLELGRDADTGGQTKYVAGFGSDPSNAQDQKRAGDHDRCRFPPLPSSVS
jgi:hypothetical protein